MIEIGIPAGADESEKRQITDLCGELTAFDDRLESLAESADEASADLSGDRRGGLRLLIVWVAVAVIGTISLGFVTGDPDLFPRLPLSMFVGLSLGFLVALPAFRRDEKTRMDRIAQSAADVADQADKSRRKLTSIIFADHHFAPDDAQWVADHRERARGYERDLAASIRTEVARPSLGVAGQGLSDPCSLPCRCDRGDRHRRRSRGSPIVVGVRAERGHHHHPRPRLHRHLRDQCLSAKPGQTELHHQEYLGQ